LRVRGIPRPKEEPKKLNLDKMASKLDTALENETKESLTDWLNSKRDKQEELRGDRIDGFAS
jgi:hypothetical protein